MGIRKKVSSGFVIIGVILFFSGLIAIFEFSRMSRSVTELITDNINSINSSRKLLDVCDSANLGLLRSLGSPSLAMDNALRIKSNMRFVEYMESLRNSNTTVTEDMLADSIMHTYGMYVGLLETSDSVWVNPYQSRRDWYFGSLQPVYYKLRQQINSLTDVSQGELERNSISLKDSFYRSIMPGVVAVSAGIVLVLLFNYFINFYLISPVIMMTKGISSYREFRKNYNVTVENDDELQDLNSSIKDIVDENRKLRKMLNQK